MPERRRRAKSKIKVDIVLDDAIWSDTEELEAAIEAAAAQVAAQSNLDVGNVQVAIVLSGDRAVADLNARYRGKAGPTNVLSFPPGAGAPPDYLGDIILARETVVGEARELDITVEHHLQHLVVHGLLHLLGLDHQNDAEAETMEAVEIQILARLGIANPYTGALLGDKHK